MSTKFFKKPHTHIGVITFAIPYTFDIAFSPQFGAVCKNSQNWLEIYCIKYKNVDYYVLAFVFEKKVRYFRHMMLPKLYSKIRRSLYSTRCSSKTL